MPLLEMSSGAPVLVRLLDPFKDHLLRNLVLISLNLKLNKDQFPQKKFKLNPDKLEGAKHPLRINTLPYE